MGKKIYILTFILFTAFLPSIGYAQKDRIDSLKNVVKNSRPDTNKVKTLNALAFSLRISDLAATEKYRKEALALSNKLKYASGIAWASYLEGVIFTYENKLMRSINSLTLALDLALRAKDYELVARIHNGIGLNNLRLEDDYNAMKSFENALTAIRKATDRSFESALLHNIGSLYVKNKKFKDAVNTLENSIEINLKRKNKTGLALNYKEMALAYYGMKDYPQAISFGDSSLSLSRETNFALNEINSLCVLGATNLKLGLLSRAKSYYDNAYRLAMPINPQREKLLIYNGYTDYYSAVGNSKEALKFQNEYAALYDSIYTVGRSKLILEYQEKLLAQQKDTENKSLRIAHLDTENQIRQSNQILLAIYSILTVFIILSGLIFWGTTKIKRANVLLLAQKTEIETQKDNVDQLNSIKDKLFSVIAHDLRTPFASLKSMMDMYDEGMITHDDIGFFFKEIRRDIGSNTLLLDNLLIWAKSQLGGFTVEPKLIRLKKVVDEIAVFYSKSLENKTINFLNRLDDQCIVASDYEMTKTIVRNLVGNAIKFTPVNGTIVVDYFNVDGETRISVTDDGIGMSDEAKEKLFGDTFYTTQGLNKEKGTGLGLQISKEFVEKNKGTIWVESEINKGSSFWFTLPQGELGIENPTIENVAEINSKDSLSELISISRLDNKYDRFELLLKASNDTIWDWDLSTNIIFWNEAMHDTFGYSEVETSIDWWSDRVNPEDLENALQVMNAAMTNNERIFEMQYGFRCADNTYKNVRDRGVIVYEDGKPTRALGIMHNMENNDMILREIKRLSLVATNVNNLVVISDAGTRVVWVNRAFENFTGYTLNEVIGKDMNTLLFGPETDLDTAKLASKGTASKQGFEAEIINYMKSGNSYWVHVNCTPYDDPISGQTGFISIHTVATERKINEKQMIEQNDALREIARITSHEVRSPLSSILGLVEIINSEVSIAERQECITMLEESAGQLDTLIHRINNHIIEIDKKEYEDA